VPDGQAIAKNQPVFLEFLQGIAKQVQPQGTQEELDSIKFAFAHPDQM
jgi:hypothetical protein